MASAGLLNRMSDPPTPRAGLLTRLAILATVLVLWEATARSGLLFEDVVPSLFKIGGALVQLFGRGEFYTNLGVTAWEVAAAMVIGGTAGIVTGMVIGGSPFLTRAYEPFLYYIGPTPKIIFFPVMIMWFGLGIPSKIAIAGKSVPPLPVGKSSPPRKRRSPTRFSKQTFSADMPKYPCLGRE